MTTRMPGMWANIASGLSEWCSGAWMPPPHGARSTIGQDSRPRVRLRSRAGMVHQLVDRGVDEALELELGDRPEALRGQADGETGDAGPRRAACRTRLGAEAGEQAVGGAEHAAVPADILAQHQDARVLLHRPGERHD